MPIIDRVGSGQVIVAAGMSGNGFKFAPTYGQVLADLATDTEPRHRHPMFTIAGHLRRAADALCAASMVLTLAPDAGPHDGDRKESRVQIIDVVPENWSIAGAPASEVRAEEIAARRARS